MHMLRYLLAPVKPKSRPRRSVTARLDLPPFEDEPGIVSIATDGAETQYHISCAPADPGLYGYRLESPDRHELCYVGIAEAGEFHVCDCPAFRRGATCRHVRGLWKLHQMGDLPPQA